MNEKINTLQESFDPIFGSLFSSAPDTILIVDQAGKIVWSNLQVEKMFGYSRHELLGQPIELLLPAHLHQEHTKLRDGYFAHPEIRPMGSGLDLRARRKDGSEFPVDISLSMVDSCGQKLATAFIRDISSRKQAEEQLRQSEEQFRAMAELSPSPIMITRQSDGYCLFANERAAQTFGGKLEETRGLKAPDFYVDPADREKVLERLARDGAVHDMELQLKKVDGTPFWVIGSLQPFRFEGDDSLLAVFTNITERKQAEEELERSARRFRELIDSLPVAARVILDGRVVFANAADASLFGFTESDEVIGTDAFDYIAPEDVERLRGYAQRRAANDPTVPNRFEAFGKRKDGSTFPAGIVITQILWEGRPAELTVTKDLTEQKKLNLYESILPVCSSCGNVRDDTGAGHGKGSWSSLEQYVRVRSDTSLSHTLCPNCLEVYREEQGLPQKKD